jgi:cysteine synthase A
MHVVSFAGSRAKTGIPQNSDCLNFRNAHLQFQIFAMSDRSRYYILGAFLLGIALTTAYNKKTSIEASDDASQKRLLAHQQKWLSQLAKINDLETLKKSLLEFGEDNVADDIKEGIEGCIGGTPLIKIKSLSEFTGCDIFAKAEV